MGTSPPRPVAELAERFERDRSFSLSPDCTAEPSPKAKTPHEQESLNRAIAATDTQMDVLVYELHGLAEEEIEVVTA